MIQAQVGEPEFTFIASFVILEGKAARCGAEGGVQAIVRAQAGRSFPFR